MTKKILVTGGAGYIGSHIVKALGEKGYEVIIIDNFSTGNRGAVLYGEVFEGDLSDTDFIESVFEKFDIEAVMHFAGSIKVPESVENPLKYFSNNTMNALNVLNACKKYNIENFIFSSTAATYGVPEGGVAFESSSKNPINPYGHSKLMTEQMLGDFAASSDKFNFITLRYFNVSGADLDGRIGQCFPAPFHLINICSEVVAGKRKKMSIYGTDYNTKDGTCVRDYIHVVDLAEAHICALKSLLDGGKSGIYNCGYGDGYSVSEIISEIKSVTGVDFSVEIGPRRDGDPDTLVANSDLIQKTLGWKPRYNSLKMIIESAINWEKSETLKQWRNQK